MNKVPQNISNLLSSLKFKNSSGVPKKLPWFTPKANGTLEILSDKYRLTVLSGSLQLKKLSIGKTKADIEDLLPMFRHPDFFFLLFFDADYADLR